MAGGQPCGSCAPQPWTTAQRWRPDAHIFTRSKLPWVMLPDGVPAFDIYYDMATQWPADSLERRRALLGDR